jgi:carbamoyltransferase
MLINLSLKKERRFYPENHRGGEFIETSGGGPLSEAPAVTHLDYSSRVQTVNKEDNGLYYEMIRSFYDKTGCPMVVNTSFNVRGEPLVCSPEDAVNCFLKADIDYLVIGSFLLDKKQQRPR